jgi:hypothetical protein
LFKEIGVLILGKNSSRRVNALAIYHPNAPPHKEIARRTGKKEDYIKHRLVLLKLPKYVQDMVKRYCQPSLKGNKLSPTIAEELYLTEIRIKELNDAGIVEKTDIKEAIKYLATKYSKERTSLVEARKIKADIAVRGFEEWKERAENIEHSVPQDTSCFICGAKVADRPWRPFCPEHLSTLEEQGREYYFTNRPSRLFNAPSPVNGAEDDKLVAMRKYREFEEVAHNVYSKRNQKMPVKVLEYLEKLLRAYTPRSDQSGGYVV